MEETVKQIPAFDAEGAEVQKTQVTERVREEMPKIVGSNAVAIGVPFRFSSSKVAYVNIGNGKERKVQQVSPEGVTYVIQVPVKAGIRRATPKPLSKKDKWRLEAIARKNAAKVAG